MLLVLKSSIVVAELTKNHLYYIISAAERSSSLSPALLSPAKAASETAASVAASRALASSLGESFSGRGSPSASPISLLSNVSFGGGLSVGYRGSGT